MNGVKDGAAGAERARRLAELAHAVRQAQAMARTVAGSGESNAEVEEMARRLEAIRIEVETLRLGSLAFPRQQIDPFWRGLLPWDQRPLD